MITNLHKLQKAVLAVLIATVAWADEVVERGQKTFVRDGITYEVVSGKSEISSLLQTRSSTKASLQNIELSNISDIKTKPILTNEDERNKFLFSHPMIRRYVGSFPREGLFKDPVYEPFISARAKCAQAVTNLTGRAGLAQYEKECLLGRTEVPEPIRRVVGIIVDTRQPIPFCGATVISGSHILTARHCFWNDDGSKTYHSVVTEGRAVFILDIEREGKKEIHIKTTSLDKVSPHRGNSTLDYVVLELERSIGSPFAELESVPAWPLGAWLVGHIALNAQRWNRPPPWIMWKQADRISVQ